MAIKPPNYTQIPNELLDKMAEMTPAEFKVLMAICRKTFGWQKSSDIISLTQLERMTGLSRTAVHHGIMAGIERGMLEQIKVAPQAFSYRLLVASDDQATKTTSSGSGPEPVASDYQPVASDYQSTQTTSSVNGPLPVVSGYSELVVSDYTQKKLAAELKKLKETPPPPLPRNAGARGDVGRGDVGLRGGGGGGGETMEIDDVGEDVESDVEDSQADEAETAHLKADLIDALAALGVRPEMAQKAVMGGTVSSDYDVILCKRFIQASTANIPAAVLWSQYLSLGRLPPAPYSETSTVTADQLAAARRMREESDRRAEAPGPVVGLAGLGAVLAGPTLRAMPAPAPLRFPAEARR